MNNQRRDYFWNTLGVFLQNAISPLLLIIITRINGITDAGIFSFAFSVSLILWAIGMWGGRTYQVSDVKHEFTSASYITVRLLTSIGILALALLFSVLNYYDSTKTILIIVLVVFKIAESLADVMYGIQQTHGHLYLAGRSLTYKMIVSLIVFIGLDLLTKDMVISSLGLVLVNVLIIAFYDIPNTRRLEVIEGLWTRFTQNAKHAGAIMRRCLPVFIVVFLSMFSLNIPRYFIDIYQPHELGYFGIIAMPITLIVMFMLFILQPNVVELSSLLERRKIAAFKKTVRTIIYIAMVGGILALVATYFIGVWFLNIIFGVDFEPYKSPLLIMVVGALFNALVFIYINVLTIARQLKGQFYILLVSNIALVCFSAMLIKQTGIIGGAILFLATNIVQFVLLTLVYERTLAKSGDEKS